MKRTTTLKFPDNPVGLFAVVLHHADSSCTCGEVIGVMAGAFLKVRVIAADEKAEYQPNFSIVVSLARGSDGTLLLFEKRADLDAWLKHNQETGVNNVNTPISTVYN